MEESRYSWKQMPEDYNASYYNTKDDKDGKKFVIIDNDDKDLLRQLGKRPIHKNI